MSRPLPGVPGFLLVERDNLQLHTRENMSQFTRAAIHYNRQPGFQRYDVITEDGRWRIYGNGDQWYLAPARDAAEACLLQTHQPPVKLASPEEAIALIDAVEAKFFKPKTTSCNSPSVGAVHSV